MTRGTLAAVGAAVLIALGWLLSRGVVVDHPAKDDATLGPKGDAARDPSAASAATSATPASMPLAPESGAPREATAAARATGVTVRAIVIDGDAGVPLEGAEVSLRAEDGQPRAIAVSGPDGVVDLVAPAGERLVVYASAPTFAPCYGIEVPGVPGTVVDAGRLELVRGVPLRGRIVDQGHRPIAGAVVSILPRLASFDDLVSGQVSPLRVALAPFRILDTTTTDERGQFVFPTVGVGFHVVAASAAGHERGVTEPIEVAGRGGAPFVTLTLRRGIPFFGRVVDGSGAAIPDARVSILGGGEEMYRSGVPPAAVSTDAEGRFRCTVTEDARLRILVRAPDGRMVFDEVPSVVGEHVTTIPAGGILEGRVFERHSGRGLPGVELSAARIGRNEKRSGPMGMAEAVTDAEGRFRFAWIPAGGSVQMEVKAVGYVLPPDPSFPEGVRMNLSILEVGPVEVGATAHRDVALIGGGTIRGRVLAADTGRGLPGVRISATHAEAMIPFSAAPFATTDAEGVFVLHPVQAGQISLGARLRGYPETSGGGGPDGEPSLVVLGDGEERSGVEIRLKRGRTLNGIVVDATGKPVGSATVKATIAGLDPSVSFRQSLLSDSLSTRATTDEHGQFVLEGLTTGDVGLAAFHPDFPLGGELRLAGETGTSVEGVRIVVSKGGTVRGRLRDVGGRHARGVAIRLVHRDPRDQGTVDQGERSFRSLKSVQVSTTEEEGHFEFRGLQPGDWEFVLPDSRDAARSGRPTGSASAAPIGVLDASLRPVEIRGEEIHEFEVALVPALSIEGIVVDEQGRPIEGATVWYRADSSEGPREEAEARSDAAGRFRLDRLRAGTGTVGAEAPERGEDGPDQNAESRPRATREAPPARTYRKGVRTGTLDVRLVLPAPRGGR